MTAPASTRHAQFAALTSVLLIAQQVAGKAARDALFLTSFHLSNLPFAMATGALLSLGAVWLLSRLMAKRPPAALTPILFAANAAGFGLAATLQISSPRLAAGALYLHTAFLGPITISAFWSLVNERFDPHTAKRAVARIAAGGTLGGVLGALAAWRISSVLPPEGILVCLGAVNAVAALSALNSATRAERSPHTQRSPLPAASGNDAQTQGLRGSIRTLRDAPFLRNLALLVAIASLTSALLDYIFSSQAVAHFGKGQALLSFFSLFWLAVGVFSFLIQVSLGRVAIEKLSLALNIAVMPGIILLGGAAGLAVPGLVSASLLRGAEAVQKNTLFRSAYELLYTPIAEVRKRTTKALIDVGFDRVGTVIGSGLILIALHGFSAHRASALLGAVVLFALATLPLARKLHLGYVEALQESLKEAESKLERPPASQRRPIDNPSMVPPERDKLVERLEQLQPGGLRALLDSSRSDWNGDSAERPSLANESLAQRIGLANELLSKDPARARRALEQLEPRDPGVACALSLLAQRDLYQNASSSLTKIAPRITGQLIDALLDPTTPFAVRRRLPRVLRSCVNQRSAEGLQLGLADQRFEVRYECGRALFHLTDTDAKLEISRDKAIAAIRYEVSLSGQLLPDETGDADDDSLPEDQTRLVEGLKEDRINRSLEHVFNILCLHLDREPLRTAFRALYIKDPKFRGTALEYLSTVLPEDARELVWPFLGEEQALVASRSATDLLRELAGAEPSQVTDTASGDPPHTR